MELLPTPSSSLYQNKISDYTKAEELNEQQNKIPTVKAADKRETAFEVNAYL